MPFNTQCKDLLFGKIFNKNANAPCQAHLPGTQSLHTNANFSKKQAMYRRFLRHTLFNWTPYSLQQTQTKSERTTKGMAKYGRT